MCERASTPSRNAVKKPLAPGALLVTLLVAFAPLARAAEPTPAKGKAGWRVEAERIGTLIDSNTEPVLSPDGRRYAYLDGKNKKWVVVLDGRVGPGYDEIGQNTLVFSPDGRRFGYVAGPKGIAFAVIDGEPGPEFQNISLPVFSSDSKRVAYLAFQGGSWSPVIDGKKEQFSIRYVSEAPVQFSRDGRHLLFFGWEEKEGTEGRMSVVLDGKIVARHEDVMFERLSRKADRLVYVAEDDHFAVIDNGKRGPEFMGIWSLELSPDERRVLYTASDPDGWHVVVDGKVGPSFEEIRGAGFSADSRHFSYLGRKDGKWRAVVDGKLGPQFDGAALYRRMPGDPTRVHAITWSGGRWHSTLNGRVQASWEGPEDAVAYEQSSEADIRASRRILRNGPEVFVFSRDGKRVARTVTVGSRFRIDVDDGKGPELKDFDMGSITFSADGKHVAYRGALGLGWAVYVDGAPGPLVDRIFPRRPKFQPDGSLVYLAADGDELMRVRHVPVKE